MDFITVSTGVVLLAILMAWYALLEYEDRRRRRDLERREHLPKFGERQVRGRELRRHAVGEVAQKLWRSNGRRPQTGMSPSTGGGKRFVFQGLIFRYGLAVTSVLLAYLFVTLGNRLFSFPPLIFFGAAVAFTFTFGGFAPGLCAFVLATLLSDFFFVKPTLVFSLDWQVFRLSAFYLLGGLLSVFLSKRLTAPRAHWKP